MSKWSGKFSTTLKETGVGPGCVYNAYQTGLLYTKLLNRLYVPIDNSQRLKMRKTDEVKGLYHFDDLHFGRRKKGTLSCCWEVQERELIQPLWWEAAIPLHKSGKRLVRQADNSVVDQLCVLATPNVSKWGFQCSFIAWQLQRAEWYEPRSAARYIDSGVSTTKHDKQSPVGGYGNDCKP